MPEFQEMDPKQLQMNPFTLIGTEWMLVTAGNESSFNTMTASWGGVGFLWNKPVSFLFIRPQRYTKEFLDREQTYTLSFFEEKYRPALSFCGSKSGRDCDKPKETGLTPAFFEGTPYFEQAKLVLACKKLYRQEMAQKSFLETELIDKVYPNGDLHTVYVGEIQRVLTKG